jgi:hypothetical protein
MIRPFLRLFIFVAAATALWTDVTFGCEIQSVLSGMTVLEIVKHTNPNPRSVYETSLIRNGSRTSNEPFNHIRAEIAPERWGLSIYNNDRTVLADIDRDFSVGLHEDDCGTHQYRIERAKVGVHIIYEDGEIIGTMMGSFPKNDFGLR